MKPETAWSGPSPVCSTHGASSPRAALALERLRQPVAGGKQRAAGELDEAAAAVVRVRLPAEREPLARPELGAEDAEGDLGAAHELVELALPLRPELGHVRRAVGREERARAVRERGRGREVGVQVLEPEPVEVRLQLGVGRGADPERVPGGEDLVREARCGQAFDRLDRAAEPVVPLEHADAPALLREQRRGGERVDPAADEDRVEPVHGRDSTQYESVELASRRSITRTASGFESTRTKRRPSFAATAPIVPLPAKKSSTSRPAGDDACTIRRRMPSGFWVG